MDYERIDKSSQGGCSPGKLRILLLGVEKRRKEEEEIDSTFSSRSEVCDIGDRGVSTSENCKEVDIVSIPPECSTSAVTETLACEMASDNRLKEHILSNSRIKSQEEGSIDYESGPDNASNSSVFEFQKTDRATQRLPLTPFSKQAPSKWDDADKWIASPTSNRPKNGQSQVPRKANALSYGNRQPAMKVVVEVPEQRPLASEEADTKRIDSSQAKREVGGPKFVSWVHDPHPVADSYAKVALRVETFIENPAVNLSQHDSVSARNATTFIPPPSTVRSVSMRDMGTEMTPIASQEPSRSGTPVRETTPMRSPSSSRPSTPGRAAPSSSPVQPADYQVDSRKMEMSEKELQMKTRKEIIALGTQLGKMNIAAWASQEEEEKDASTSLKTLSVDPPAKSVVEARAAAWEEAEKAKYMARFKREEIKIHVWENHQKAKTEAEMRKIEVEVERMRGRAQDRLMNKLAAARHKAEEKRAAAEVKRNQQAAKTEQQTEYIRRTGRIPSSFSFCNWCC